MRPLADGLKYLCHPLTTVYCYLLIRCPNLKRKMLAAREDLVNEVIEVANKRGFTLYALTNEALQRVIEADRMGLSLSEVADECKVLDAAKRGGFVLVPEMLLYEVLEKTYKEMRDWMTKVWAESGEWFGKYYSFKNPENNIDILRRDICSLFWNVGEFSINKNENSELSVKCIGSRFPESYAAFLSAFLEGAFNALGYRCVEKHIAKGFVNLKFEALKEG